MSASNFDELSWHVGHDVEVVTYQKGGHIFNIAIECNDCGTVLIDFNNPKNGYQTPVQQMELQLEGAEN